MFVVPNFLWRRHINTGPGDAVLYSVSDAPFDGRRSGNTGATGGVPGWGGGEFGGVDGAGPFYASRRHSPASGMPPLRRGVEARTPAGDLQSGTQTDRTPIAFADGVYE